VPDPQGLVAVVTGASRGLGAGMADRFAAAGLALGLCARHEPAAPSASSASRSETRSASSASRSETRSAPVGTLTAAVDVTAAGAVDCFCSAVAERFGRIDLWVNNAGVLEPIGPLRDADPAALRSHVEVNVLGVLHGSAAFARHVRSRPGGGVLVNITSGAATKPYEGWSAYCASKAAVDQATRVIAAEEADAGLRAYAVAPGVVDTDMHALIRATPADRFPEVGRFLRLKRDEAYNSPAWVADHILRLLVDPLADAPIVQRVPDEPRDG
jgi:benzil reductase ((S)-benzoin forming)